MRTTKFVSTARVYYSPPATLAKQTGFAALEAFRQVIRLIPKCQPTVMQYTMVTRHLFAKHPFRFLDADNNAVVRVSFDRKTMGTRAWLHSELLENDIRLVEITGTNAYDFYEGRLKIVMLHGHQMDSHSYTFFLKCYTDNFYKVEYDTWAQEIIFYKAGEIVLTLKPTRKLWASKYIIDCSKTED